MEGHPTRSASDYEPMAVTCPRCRTTVQRSFYGLCESCVEALRLRYAPGEQTTFEKAEFEPTMHVTPNAVAQKDD